jgi:hypothetical protein
MDVMFFMSRLGGNGSFYDTRRMPNSQVFRPLVVEERLIKCEARTSAYMSRSASTLRDMFTWDKERFGSK